MLRLIVQDGSLAGHQYQLRPGEQQWIVLGRSDDCDARFTETDVSLRHAIVTCEDEAFYLLDRQSRDGTFVNGVRVEGVWLSSGDVIQLGSGGPRLQVSIESIETGRISRATTSPIRRGGGGATGGFDTARLSTPQTARVIMRQTANHLGLYNPTQDSGRPLRSPGITFLMMFCAVMGLMVLGLTVLDLGFIPAMISSLVAFVPAIVYLSVFLWLDRFDPEPPATLAFAFAWGATISVFFSGIVNDLFGIAIGEPLTGIYSAPVVEEACKGLGVLLIALLFRKDFDSVVDGIVYAGVVALGFATMENIDYYGRSLVKGGAGSLAATFFIRGVMAPFSHVLFSSMIGIGVGIARETHKLKVKVLAPISGLFGAMFLHYLWNKLASYDSGTFLRGYFLLEVPLFIGFVCLIVYLVKREGRILRRVLESEVERGLIARHHLEIAISVFRRTGWIAAALGNARLFNARRQFLRAVAKLGLCHWHKDRANEAQKDTGSLKLIAQLQAEVFALKDEV